MNPIKSLKKLLVGEPLDWHLPHTLGPDDALAKCAHCSGIFVISKSEQRATYYCMGCR
jgi:hypothetical protein